MIAKCSVDGASSGRVRGAARVGGVGAAPVVGAGGEADGGGRGEGIGPVAVAAGQAVLEAGTEVSPTEVGGTSRGPRGRWAVLRHRRQSPVDTSLPAESLPAEEATLAGEVTLAEEPRR